MINDFPEDLIGSPEVAALLGMSARHFRERYVFAAEGFPRAFRYKPTGPRYWSKREVLVWRETKREAA